APKSVLLGDDAAVVLLDFELGDAISDPAYDPGFLAGHYLLMGECRPDLREAAGKAGGAVALGYIDSGPPTDAGWLRRLARYAAATMLYRLYRSTPAPY